jgi:hypothetical protein
MRPADRETGGGWLALISSGPARTQVGAGRETRTPLSRYSLFRAGDGGASLAHSARAVVPLAGSSLDRRPPSGLRRRAPGGRRRARGASSLNRGRERLPESGCAGETVPLHPKHEVRATVWRQSLDRQPHDPTRGYSLDVGATVGRGAVIREARRDAVSRIGNRREEWRPAFSVAARERVARQLRDSRRPRGAVPSGLERMT